MTAHHPDRGTVHTPRHHPVIAHAPCRETEAGRRHVIRPVRDPEGSAHDPSHLETA
ncbi:hypothetical protein ACFUIW_38370 [Streptomyces sp. NPDC057245]|uniref:hypothetical protein n=1 Tax=Streptomyces TaxID=1883 RepID=UPI001C1E338A|nr:hypothetical protein [Streptomyces sp. A108]MBU6533043.1 hypothetical protein [Streptomyces sp. A108]